MIMNCNRCDKPFPADINMNFVSPYYGGVARQERGPMNDCPFCGMSDHHYIYKRNQSEEGHHETASV